MSTTQTNPLFAIAADKHREDRQTGSWGVLTQDINNETTYTLGFCRGVAYAAGIFQKQIELLQTQVSELSKPKQ